MCLGKRSVVAPHLTGSTTTFSMTAPKVIASQICGSTFTIEFDALGVAAALKIEHALITPAMFVVADESAVWVCRQRRVAGYR